MFQWDFLPKQPLHHEQAKEIPILPPPAGYQPDPPTGWDWVATFGKSKNLMKELLLVDEGRVSGGGGIGE